MENLHIAMAAATAVILFVFGLEHFSREIQAITGDRFRRFLGNATRMPIIGVAIGAGVTAVIQSSSATSVIAISLVDAGVLSFRNSVGIIFGSNIGTTITAQLVAFKLTAFAPVMVIAGFLLSLLPTRWSIFGKVIFYFGFVFFSLNLISSSLEPLQQDPALVAYLTQPQSPLLAILVGCLFTAVVQSSSVTTGLAIVFIQQGLLSLENAVPLIMGANIGTTVTAGLAMFSMDLAAKKAALSHILFNIGGVVLFMPPLLLWGSHLANLDVDPAIALATIHFLFNMVTSIVFVIFITPFTAAVDKLLGEGSMDFKRLRLPVFSKELDFDQVRQELDDDITELLAFLQENYNLVTLSIETNYGSIYDAAEKRIEYVDFVKRDLLGYFSHVVASVSEREQSRRLIELITQYDYLFQLHDSITDLFDAKRAMNARYIELGSDVLILVRELSGETLGFFGEVRKDLAGEAQSEIHKAARELQRQFDEVNADLLRLMSDPDRLDAGALTNFVTYSRRLNDKLVKFHEIRARALESQADALVPSGRELQ